MAFWSRFLGTAPSYAVGFGVGAALAPTLQPITQAIANEVWAQYPNRPLAASTAAQLAGRGFWEAVDAQAEALMSGYNSARVSDLIDLASQPPSINELLSLRNRGKITPLELDAGLHENSLPARWRSHVEQLRFALAPQTDLVRMAVREVFDPAQRAALDLDEEFPEAFATEAAKLGMTRDLAKDYWAAHWELPSFEQGAEMFHRKILKPGEFDGLLKALDYAPTWRQKLRDYAAHIPPLSDMIRFAVREVYSPTVRERLGLDDDYPPEFTTEAALHGMDADRAKQYWAAHWRLPSAEQGYRMLWRIDDFTQADLRTLLRALDYPPTWRSRLEEISHIVPGRIDLRRMLAHGVIDRNDVKRGYERLGYTTADAETLTVFAEELAAGGADGASTTDYVAKAQGQLWTAVHRAYMRGTVDDPQAVGELALIGVPLAQRDAVVDLWREERSFTRLTLTPAQIVKAYKKAVIYPPTGAAWTEADVLTELMELGYTREDAGVFLAESL